ncbi:hypothetical protein FX988_03501 [Paraglaciecola mesophila]|uniref:Strictosidine synthase conserved region domain-containing protein n=1 Tax=Paraglaciecola mesophila TaxID=197222 RepID=A0A857JQ16_9ALTE|nr:SMP-30/gluconolactonase/LRE family protein [Paraglaciecola mesophila]QHJ13240.1 hypothetical protein FX988_03501 [Paraglaciecola mesophila]
MKYLKLSLLAAFVLITYLLFWPVPVEPIAWQAPKNPGYLGLYASNTRLANLENISLNGQHGPEDFAFLPDGTIATATHSGNIMLLAPKDKEFTTWVNTGGRPLGIEFDKQGHLLVADAVKGLLSVSPSGEISLLTNRVAGTDIVYADDVDVAADGTIYFSDATNKFSAPAYGGTLAASLLEILEHKGNGRLLAYDPRSRSTSVLLEDLVFANGVSVSHDQRSVLVNETGSYRVMRYWLSGPKAGTSEVFIDNLPGFPDNIARSPTGGYWLGFASPRSESLDDLSRSPFLRKVVQRLPSFMRPQAKDYGHVIKINEKGEVVMDLQDPKGQYPLTTGVLETKDALYISSLIAPSVGRKSLK